MLRRRVQLGLKLEARQAPVEALVIRDGVLAFAPAVGEGLCLWEAGGESGEYRRLYVEELTEGECRSGRGEISRRLSPLAAGSLISPRAG